MKTVLVVCVILALSVAVSFGGCRVEKKPDIPSVLRCLKTEGVAVVKGCLPKPDVLQCLKDSAFVPLVACLRGEVVYPVGADAGADAGNP